MKKKTDIAKRALAYLSQTRLQVKWDFPEDDPPPAEIASLLKSCFKDGEFEQTTGVLLRDYLTTRLREEFLITDKPIRSNYPPRSRGAAFRVVYGDE
jgi:hypothetical protein